MNAEERERNERKMAKALVATQRRMARDKSNFCMCKICNVLMLLGRRKEKPKD